MITFISNKMFCLWFDQKPFLEHVDKCHGNWGPYVNTVQQLFEIEHFRFTMITTSIVNQSFEIRHELRSLS